MILTSHLVGKASLNKIAEQAKIQADALSVIDEASKAEAELRVAIMDHIVKELGIAGKLVRSGSNALGYVVRHPSGGWFVKVNGYNELRHLFIGNDYSSIPWTLE